MEGSTALDKGAMLEQFQASIKNLTTINDKATKSLATSSDFNNAVYKRLVPINETIKNILKYITTINARIKELEGQVQQNQQMGQGNAEEIEKLKTEIKQLTADKQQLTQEKTKLDATIQQLTTEKEAIQIEITALKTTIAAKGGEDVAKAAAIEEAAKKNQAALEEVNAKLDTCKQQVDQLKIEKEQTDKSILQNTDAVQKLTAENAALKTENDDLIKKIIEATTAISSAQEKIDQIFNAGLGTNSESQNKVNKILTEIERDLGLINDAIQGRGAGASGPSGLDAFIETTTDGLRGEQPPKIIAQPGQLSVTNINEQGFKKNITNLPEDQQKLFNWYIVRLNKKISDVKSTGSSSDKYTQKKQNFMNFFIPDNDGNMKIEEAMNMIKDPSQYTNQYNKPGPLQDNYIMKQSNQDILWLKGGVTKKRKRHPQNKTKKRRRQRGGFVVGNAKKRERIISIRRGSFNKRRRTRKTGTRTTSKRTGKQTTSKRTSKRTGTRTGTRTTSY